MTKIDTRTALQVAGCASCTIVAWFFGGGFERSEFPGGGVTGPLFRAYDVSLLLFAIATLLTFARPRIAATLAIIAVVLAAPLYAYVIAPGPFRALIGGVYSVPYRTALEWHSLAVTGGVVTVFTFWISVRVLISRDA